MAKVPVKLGDDTAGNHPPASRVSIAKMQSHHHIVGSESLGRKVLSPGYGALHRGVGLRRRSHLNLVAAGTWIVLAFAGLSVVGLLTGNPQP
jgi:hypothetical protein